MTRIACLKQLNARVPVRVPRRWRSACSRLETNSTVSSRTLNVAVYVTLIRRRTPMKLDCERTTFIPGFCVFPLHPNRFRVSQPPWSMPTYRPETVTRKGSVRLDGNTYRCQEERASGDCPAVIRQVQPSPGATESVHRGSECRCIPGPSPRDVGDRKLERSVLETVDGLAVDNPGIPVIGLTAMHAKRVGEQRPGR